MFSECWIFFPPFNSPFKLFFSHFRILFYLFSPVYELDLLFFFSNYRSRSRKLRSQLFRCLPSPHTFYIGNPPPPPPIPPPPTFFFRLHCSPSSLCGLFLFFLLPQPRLLVLTSLFTPIVSCLSGPFLSNSFLLGLIQFL